jgi:tetratricopeptide (TPR) repeat protein
MVAVYLGHLRAMGELRAGNYAAAAEILEPLTQQSPESAQLLGTLGKAYLALGCPGDAQRAFEASLRCAPDDPEKLCALGDAYRRQGQTAEAVEQYEHAVAAAPDFALAHNRLGQVYAGQGQFDRACEHLRRDVEINPTSPRALCDMGQVLVEMGRYEEAAEYFRQALCENPEFARAHRFLWRAVAAGGDRLEAISALRSACPALPENLVLKRELAGLLATTPQASPGHVREAVRLAQECCESDAGAPESWDVLAVAYAAMGDFARAAETARRALSIAESQGRTKLARQIAGRLRVYRARSGP